MSNDDIANKEKQLKNGEEALAVLNSDAYHNAYAKYQAELFREFTDSPADDTERREEIYRQMKSLDKVDRNLRKAVETGNIAKNSLFNKHEVI